MLQMKSILFRLVTLLIGFSILPINLVSAQGSLPVGGEAALSGQFFPAGLYQDVAQADSTPPNISVWYGDNQRFDLGTPQRWINILGTVTESESSITSLSYTLNGSSNRALRIGPDGRRLISAGDFNIDISISDSILRSGTNTVMIRAANSAGLVSQKEVKFAYTDGKVWPLPYTINWSQVSKVQDAVQIVDGKWEITGGGLRTTQVAYDRVVAIGDLTWKDYEILVPVTVHWVNPQYLGDPIDSINGRPKVGLDLRWTGHTNDPSYCTQPLCGWKPTGASTKHRWTSPTNGHLRLGTYQMSSDITDSSVTFAVGKTYWYRARVETNSSGGTTYSMKAWENGKAEPSSWNLSASTSNDPSSPVNRGSFILVAHHVDATFGNITVTGIGQAPVTYTLNVQITGQGQVSVSPQKSSYSAGETVTLTAVPAGGWYFSNWSDFTSNNPKVITINGNTSITANFKQNNPDPQPEKTRHTFVPLIVK